MYTKIKIRLSKDFQICEATGCFHRATEHHHWFPDTKVNRRLYGKLIDADFNVELFCQRCHDRAENCSEGEFCRNADIAPKGKSLAFKKFDFNRS
jgi:hypothetical protein